MRCLSRKAAKSLQILERHAGAERHHPAKSDDPRHRPVGRQCHARNADRARRLVCRRRRPNSSKRFNSKYSGAYGSKPPRIASLAYDAVSLATGLARKGDFSSAAITDAGGFQGQNGLFRFRSDGLIERGLAILEMTSDGPQVVAQPPNRFGAGF